MKLPEPRGPFSATVCALLNGTVPAHLTTGGVVDDPAADDDLQLALYLCYELHYRGIDGVDDRAEWDPKVLGFRAELEARFEMAVRELAVVAPSPHPIDVQLRSDFAHMRLLSLEPRAGANGKVAGVHAGVFAARNEHVVIADDDVRYDIGSLAALAAALAEADLVLPQNHFAGPARWHSIWDTGRTLLARSVGHDYPGTLALRRTWFMRAGGYGDGSLFENLELIRTVRASGGVVRWRPDIYVPRVAPTSSTFWSQRIRQAYDDLAQPGKLFAMLAIVPACAVVVRRCPRYLVIGLVGVIGAAEMGRRRHGGAQRFSVVASLGAPVWVLERAVCAWIAVWVRLFRGGVKYRDGRLRKAATPSRALRRRFHPARTPLRAHRRTMVSPGTVRTGRAPPHLGGPVSRVHPRPSVRSALERGTVRHGTS